MERGLLAPFFVDWRFGCWRLPSFLLWLWLCYIRQPFVSVLFRAMTNNKLIMLILWTLLLQACGQTGPLYMPDSPPPIYVPKQDK